MDKTVLVDFINMTNFTKTLILFSKNKNYFHHLQHKKTAF
jgi:hypothetical protein